MSAVVSGPPEDLRAGQVFAVESPEGRSDVWVYGAPGSWHSAIEGRVSFFAPPGTYTRLVPEVKK